jgi:hypothetical protein
LELTQKTASSFVKAAAWIDSNWPGMPCVETVGSLAVAQAARPAAPAAIKAKRPMMESRTDDLPCLSKPERAENAPVRPWREQGKNEGPRTNPRPFKLKSRKRLK